MRIADCDADLTDPPQPFLDQTLMSLMKRLIPPDKERRRHLRIEGRPKLPKRTLGPVLRRSLGSDV